MQKEFKGKLCEVRVDGNNIFAKQTLIKEEFTLDNILVVEFKKASSLMNGTLLIQTEKSGFLLAFSKKQEDDFLELFNYIKDNSNAYVSNNTIGLEYKGGHPAITLEGMSKISICDNGIYLVVKGMQKANVDYRNITSIKVETQEQMSSRFTATRIALLGPFALAFKKKKKSTEKFLTIDFNDNNGIESTMIFSGNFVPTAHNQLYEAYSKYIEENGKPVNTDNQQVENNQTSVDPYAEVKKIKELLDMGILSQEEFDKKKNELLGL